MSLSEALQLGQTLHLRVPVPGGLTRRFCLRRRRNGFGFVGVLCDVVDDEFLELEEHIDLVFAAIISLEVGLGE